jgi:hypothetical protein
VSDPLRLGDVAFSGSDGAGWGITGDRLLVRQDAGGTATDHIFSAGRLLQIRG